MGHDTKNKSIVQIKRIKNALIKLVETTNAIMYFNLTLMSEEKDIKITKKIIQQGKKAIETIQSVKHIDILTDLYNSFITNNMAYFVSFNKVVSDNKKIRYWDTEKGFKDFLKAREIALAKCDKEAEEKRKENEEIEKAKAEGKEIALMYKDGKVKRVVVQEKPN